jgi:steroid 5-alpha reductase family enzyme
MEKDFNLFRIAEGNVERVNLWRVHRHGNFFFISVLFCHQLSIDAGQLKDLEKKFRQTIRFG